MTESTRAGHYFPGVSRSVTDVLSIPSKDESAQPTVATGGLTIESLYRDHFDFVWRSVKHLGVADAAVDDAVQDTFVVAHRRLADFAGRSSPRTWLFGIALRVARDHRRSRTRRERFLEAFGHKPTPPTATPFEQTVRGEASRVLRGFLDTLPEEQRSVFVLAELEQLTAPEISEVLSVNLNTVYSRLRVARAAFNAAVATVATSESKRQNRTVP